MPDLHEKLRRFRLNWITAAAKTPVGAARVPGFKSRAEDTLPSWVRRIAAFPPIAEVAAARRALPRFAYLATQDDDQLAA
jgi:hypothetical protein